MLLAEPFKPEMSLALHQSVGKLSISANVVGIHPKVNQITSVMSNPTMLTQFLHFSPFPTFSGLPDPLDRLAYNYWKTNLRLDFSGIILKFDFLVDLKKK